MSKHTTYWFGVIKKAITRKNKGEDAFTEQHREKSADWVTCACGKQDPRIPRFSYDQDWDPYSMSGSPVDEELNCLGEEFCEHVCKDNPAMALGTLIKIEKRAAEVLKEVGP